ncbi:MAG: cytochrome c-type biogenesis protein CcmH [Nitrospinota bacterium]|nr:cytochrome c-type biogenesis protein CcmH [Nitrospinota bacterium]
MRQFCRLIIPLFVIFSLTLAISTSSFSQKSKTTYGDVSKSLMSPVCPGKMLSDCPSSEGSQLREVVRRMIREGKSKEEILLYFVEVYGKSVLSVPPSEGFLITSWLLPFVVFVSGLIIFFLLVFSWLRREGVAEKEKSETIVSDLDSRVERQLNDFEG